MSTEPRKRMTLLLLCNEAMRKRCQTLAATLQESTCVSRLALTVRLKCVTHVEHVTGGAFSLSKATERVVDNADLFLCLLRVSRVHPEAWHQLVDKLEALHSRTLCTDRVLLVQCRGSDYTLHSARGTGKNSSHADLDALCDTSSPFVVDCHLRAWLAACAGCKLADLADLSVENNSAGKVLRHRLFGHKYTMQVEFSSVAPDTRRRGSLYRLTEGLEAENGGCSPAAVARRRFSLGNDLDSNRYADAASLIAEDVKNNDNTNCGAYRQEQQQLETFTLDPSCKSQTSTASAVTLVVCASKSCAREAALCLNNLSSRGHRAVTLEALVSSNQQRDRQPSGGRRPGGRLSRHLSRLSPSTLSGAVLLLLCRRPASRLLADFLRVATDAASANDGKNDNGAAVDRAPPLLPRACFVALTDPVSEADYQELQRLSSSAGVPCQLDVVYSQDGLRGARVIECLTPGLTALVRQLETPFWWRRDCNEPPEVTTF